MTPDRIEGVECLTVSLPLARPLWASGLRITHREYLAVRILTAAGRCGVAFHKSRGLHLNRIVERNLAPHLIGRDPWTVERLWYEMYQATLLSGRTGAVMRALGTLDIALWDLRAQMAGVPLHRLLGGFRDRCRVLLVSGYYEEDPNETAPMVEDLAHHARLGFDFFKIAAGMLDAGADGRRIAAAREAIGPAAELVVDVNWVWEDLKEALRTARRWEGHRLRWIEEPFPPGSTAKRRAFARRSPVALALGDEQSGVALFHDLIATRSVDVVRVDTPVLGGITPTLRVIAMADAAGLPVSPHIYPEINVHLAAAYRNVLAVETFSTRSDLYQIDRFITPGLDFDGGSVAAPKLPGLGFQLDWSALGRHGT